MPQATTRDITRLALPAFLTLIAEPIFLLVDTAVVGHLDTDALAALGAASAVLLTASSVFVFLAYGTTAVVSRRIGAGDRRGAITGGVDGVWLALVLAVGCALVILLLASPFVGALGATGVVRNQAATFLRVSCAGLPGMLIVLAATGVLRGVQDTVTPLVVATVGFTANAALNWALVFPCDLGLVGSALGTVLAQTGMAIALLVAVLRLASRTGASIRPHAAAVLRAAKDGVPLLVRTLALRAALLLTTAVAAANGEVALAAHQVAGTIFSFLAFALDALAIAAQTLTGTALGAGDVDGTRQLTDRLIRWGAGTGVAAGLVTLLALTSLPRAFTSDPAVARALIAGLVPLALAQPIAGVVFVLDGILIGAGDAVALAWLQLAALAAYLPVVWWLHSDHAWSAGGALRWIWIGFAWFLCARAAGLLWRARNDGWLRIGA